MLKQDEYRVLNYKGKAVGISTPAMREINISLIERAKIEDPIVAKYFDKRIKWLSEEARQITVNEERDNMKNNQIDTIGLYNEIVKEIRQEVDDLPFTPSYVCYLIGDNKASEKYVSLKHKTSEEANINCIIKRLTKEQFVKEMRNVMLAYEMNGYQPLRAMLQLPADEECVALFNDRVIEGAIIDVDHLGDDVLIDMWLGNFDRVPGTPRGVVAVLFEELGSLSGKKIAVVGSRSKTTGRFLIPMLQHHNATVSLYHSRSILQTGEFDKYDAVVSCVGRAGFIKLHHLGTYQKVLIDVGVDFVDGKVRGDFDTDVREHHRYTPYVNGVGALTRAMLVRNVLDTYMIGGKR